MFAPVTREWEVSMEGKSVILSPTSSQSLRFLKVGADGKGVGAGEWGGSQLGSGILWSRKG